MIKNTRPLICFLFFFLGAAALGSVNAFADAVPGRWELVESLPVGSQVAVKSFANEPVQGVFLRLDPEYLIIKFPSDSDSEIRILRNQVTEVTILKQKRFWTATKVGAIAGFAAGLIIGLAAGDDGIFDDMTAGFNGLVLGGVGAGAGTLAGAAIESTSQRPAVIYRAARKAE